VHPAVARLRLLAPLLAAWVAAPGGAGLADEPDHPQRPPASGESPPAEPPSPPAAPEAPPAKPAEEEHDTWLDVSHAFIEERVFAPILRFDRFFSDEREIEAERARSFLRWRSEIRFVEGGSQPILTTGVRATLRLPGLNKRLRRLRIVIAGETRDAVSTLFPREPTEEGPSAEPTVDDDDVSQGDAGLRFFLWDTVVSHADLGGGVLVELPPGAYGRLRFRWAIPVSSLFLTRTAVTGFLRTDVGFGTSVAAEIERPLTPRLAVRLGGAGTLSEESAGVEWSGELAVLAAFGERSGAQVGVAVNGATGPLPLEGTTVIPPDVDRYRVYTRLRRDFYRHWLFLEVEPELAWRWDAERRRHFALAPGGGGVGGVASPWETERRRHPVWGIALRLEVQFHGNEAPPRPPSPPPEPPDPPSAEEDAGPAEPSGG
jgi:hypothetical protein